MTPQTIDLVNCLFELVGAVLAWMNVRRLIRDKVIHGVYWQTWVFLTIWNVWSDIFYLSLGQHLSLFACLVLTSANATWVALALWYKYRLGKLRKALVS